MKKTIIILSLIITHLGFSQVTDTGDKVGIGTTTPEAKLEVTENSSTDAVALRLTNSGWTSLMSTSLEFKTGYAKSVPTSKISSIMNGSGNAGDRLGFFVQENGTNPNNNPLVEKLSLLPNGNVGIGTTTPQGKLEVKRLGNTLGGKWIPTNSYLTLDSGNGSVLFLDPNEIYGSGTLHIGSKSGDIVKFRTVSETSSSDKFVIKNNGNVGIGLTTPNYELNIHDPGTGTIDSRVQLTNTDTGTSWSDGFQIIMNGSSNNYKVNLLNRENSDMGFWTNNTERVTISNTGNVGIGTTDTKGFKLGVQGKIAAEEVKVAVYANWADFVFNKDYNLPTLKDVEQHIKDKGHLKDIPSAEAVKKNGIFLGEMDAKLLQKIEELTLYTIAQQKQIEALENTNKKLEKEKSVLKSLLERVKKLEEKIKS